MAKQKATEYKIDTVSNLFPALGGHVYRQCAVFKEPVDLALLRKAVCSLSEAFPIMCSHLRKTFFSYVHEKATDLDVVNIGDPFIQRPPMFDTEKPSFLLFVDGCLLSMDVFHGNADGNSAIQFFKALVTNYAFLLRGLPLPPVKMPDEADLKDPYPMYYKPAKPASLSEKPSYHLHLARPESFYQRFSCISIDVAGIKNQVKPLGYTVNDFLCALLHQAILHTTDAKQSDLDVTISVPIDLRPFYHSNSQRNFVYYTNVRLSKDAAPDMASAMGVVHREVQAAMQEKVLRRGVAVAHKAANNLFVRCTPRAIKEFVIRKAYRHVAGGGLTTTLSNVGYHTLPPEAEACLERFEMYLGAGFGGINATAAGVKGRTSLCISCGSHETVIEDEVCEILKGYGIDFSRTQREYTDYRFEK